MVMFLMIILILLLILWGASILAAKLVKTLSK